MLILKAKGISTKPVSTPSTSSTRRDESLIKPKHRAVSQLRSSFVTANEKVSLLVVASIGVGANVGSNVGKAEGVEVGTIVGEKVGKPVGPVVGNSVGESVGADDGKLLGCNVGEDVPTKSS